MPSPYTPSNRASSAAASRRLFQFGTAAVIVACAYLGYTSPLTDPLQIALGLGMLVLAALPALLWAREARTHFPAFEIFMLTGVNFYAVPMLSGINPDLFAFPDRAVVDAALVIVLFQVCAIAAFVAARGHRARSPLLTEPLLPERVQYQTQAGMWLNTIYLGVASFTAVIPYNLLPIFRAIFVGIGIVSAFIQARLWGEGKLDRTARLICGFNLAAQLVLLFSNLYLISGISLVALFLIAYVTASRRLPIVFLAVFIPILAVLHNGKSAMREIYWHEDPQAKPTLTELPAFYAQWFRLGLHTGVARQKSRTLTENLLERAALFHMVCLTVDRIPDFLPFLDGDTYKDIPAQLVPRVLWPGKPSPALSNSRLAIYLGLVTRESAKTVSIAFGFIAEAYANFGFWGVAGLGLILGWFFKRVSSLGQGVPQFSALGLFLILLTAWSFQVEQVMATWLTSLFQATVAIVGIPVAIHYFLGRK